MDKRAKKLSLILLLFPMMFMVIGCNYMLKNEKQQVYSKPKYGIDKFVVVRNYNIHYVEAGEGQPILLIPGAFSTYREWNRVIPVLSKSYKVLAIDYLGAGDSDKPQSGFGYTIEEQADLIAMMIEKLQLPKVHIAGVSYGGGIALNLAARYRDRVSGIVCIEGNGGMKHDKVPYRPMEAFLKWPVIGHATIGTIRSGLIDGIITKLVVGKAWNSMSHTERKEITEIISQNNKTASRVSWYHISRTLETSKEFVEDTKTIRAPILYLYGENSGYRELAEVNIDFFKNHLPNVEIICFKDGIHDLELQKPEEVANLVLEFLRGNPKQEENSSYCNHYPNHQIPPSK
jgi:pimeloyl-ACP methyl ester carboxylesterase